MDALSVLKSLFGDIDAIKSDVKSVLKDVKSGLKDVKDILKKVSVKPKQAPLPTPKQPKPILPANLDNMPDEKRLSLVRNYVYTTLSDVFGLTVDDVRNVLKDTIKEMQGKDILLTSTTLIKRLRETQPEILEQLKTYKENEKS
jgi:hypothetical protein